MFTIHRPFSLSLFIFIFFSSCSSFTCISYIHSNDDGDADLVSDAMNEVQCCSSGSTEKSVRVLLGIFTNHIWTEAINYETHPSLNKHIQPYRGARTHSHTSLSFNRAKLVWFGFGFAEWNSSGSVNLSRSRSVSLCFFYASRAKQGPWLWLFSVLQKKLKTIKFTSQVPEVARAD